jgi:hypothetical protein
MLKLLLLHFSPDSFFETGVTFVYGLKPKGKNMDLQTAKAMVQTISGKTPESWYCHPKGTKPEHEFVAGVWENSNTSENEGLIVFANSQHSTFSSSFTEDDEISYFEALAFTVKEVTGQDMIPVKLQ